MFENLSNEDLDYLEKNVKALERTPEKRIEAITELDLAFHKKLCLISGNSLIIRVNQILSDLFQKSMQDVVVALGNQTGRVYHRRIFEAMRQGHIENTIHSIRQATLRQEPGPKQPQRRRTPRRQRR